MSYTGKFEPFEEIIQEINQKNKEKHISDMKIEELKNKNESNKMLISQSIFTCFISFVIASFELVLFSIVITKSLGNILGNDINANLDLFSILIMFLTAFAISLISCFVVDIF